MLDRGTCPHLLRAISWASTAKREDWVRCDDCGEVWKFEWMLSSDLPGLGRRMTALIPALAKASSTSTVPLAEVLGPEVTLGGLNARLGAESRAVEARQAAYEESLR